jgi:exodeoxyribonuclease V alpha subunit
MGRAAKRMTEATGFEAKIIHRLLEVDPRTRWLQARWP